VISLNLWCLFLGLHINMSYICNRLAGLTDGFDDVLRMLPQKENDDTDNIGNINTSRGNRFKKRKVF